MLDNRRSSKTPLFLTLKSLAERLVLFGLLPVVEYHFVRVLLEARATSSWPQVEALITNSRIKSRYLGVKTFHAPAVEYNYRVEGRNYTGSGIRPGGMSAMKSEARDIADRFPIGSKTLVSYDPVHPNVSYLFPGAEPRTGVETLKTRPPDPARERMPL
jgi:hypothetical protein